MNIDFKELQAASNARRVTAAYYLYNPRVTLIDVGWKFKDGEQTDQLAVRVHVRNKPTEAAFETFSLQNEALIIDKGRIPFDVVDFIKADYRLHYYWWRWAPVAPKDERARRRNPLCGGLSISNNRTYNYGTLGGIVRDKTTREPMILSNWHVLAGKAYYQKGQLICQPGLGDGGCPGDAIASLERDVMVKGIDAAVAKLSGARDWANDQLKVGPVKGAEYPRLGMLVTKSGRGSDLTFGIIDGVEGEYPIRYGGLSRRIKYVHRIVPQPGRSDVSRGGDSGSWWLNQSTNRAVGLHFAGFDETALAIAMPQVLNALNVEIWV